MDDGDGGDDGAEERASARLVEPGDAAQTRLSELLFEGLYWVRFSLMRAALPRRLRR